MTVGEVKAVLCGIAENSIGFQSDACLSAMNKTATDIATRAAWKYGT
jgi:hypothetical protein